MRKNLQVDTNSSEDYALAYAMHYKEKNLTESLSMYRKIIQTYPDSSEYSYSQQQIRNIFQSVIPMNELLNVQIEMLLVHFRKEQNLS